MPPSQPFLLDLPFPGPPISLTAAALVAAAAALLAGAVLLLAGELRRSRLERRIHGVLRREVPPRRPARMFAHGLVAMLRGLGETLRQTTLLSRADIDELERSVAATGLNPRQTASAIMGAKLLLFVLLPVGAYFLAGLRGWSWTKQMAATGMAVPLGLMLPNMALGWVRRRYREALHGGLPDALDLMVVCAEAGLGFETTIERVAAEIRATHRAVALELAILEHELRVGSDRRRALAQLGERSGLPGFRRLAGTLLQTLEYGTPLAHGLRTLSREMRRERLTKFEERAARLPALLVPPMILFIMPVLFIVLLGPSAVKLLAALRSLPK